MLNPGSTPLRDVCAMLACAVAHVATRILGPLEVTVDGCPVEFRSPRERALLGVLLLHAGNVVSVDALIESVWGDDPPRTARHLVHEYVSRLRSGLGDAALIATRAPGYIVGRDACELDARRFREIVAVARAAAEAGSHADALRHFDEALALWRGDVLGDLVLGGGARTAAERLDDERRAAGSERIDVALALGRHHQIIPELERAVAAEPLDEHLRARLMLALYRDGRQADALARYREGRTTLVEELGLEPNDELRALEAAILRHDPSLALPTAGATPADPHPTRRRRTVVTAAAVVLIVAALGVVTAVTTRSAAPTLVRGDAVAVVDAAAARVIGSLPLTTPPGAIAYGDGSVWVSSPAARSVVRISPQSRRVTASIPLTVAPQSLAVAGAAVWALGSGATDPYVTLERIDPTFGTPSRARRLPVVVGGDTGSLSARGKTLLVAPRTGPLNWIDARSGQVLRRLDPNAAPSAAALGFGSTWLAYRDADEVLRVEPSGAITPIPVGRGPSAIAVGKR
jgi:DNA-binding SARP family transcriptional activator